MSERLDIVMYKPFLISVIIMLNVCMCEKGLLVPSSACVHY